MSKKTTSFAIALLAATTLAGCSSGSSTPRDLAPAVSVSGNRLVDGAGHTLVLRGVTRQDSEIGCPRGNVFTDPTGASSLQVLRGWHVNTVRLLLNEDCWLGINGVPAAAAGAAYRSAVVGYVNRLNAAGLIAIVSLGWTAPGSELSDNARAQFMADTSHAAEVWKSVAATFADHPSVLFDLFSEPYDVSWNCWRDGCTTAAGWQATGMQQLLDAVRAAGAHQPVLLSGLDEGNDLSGWLTHLPRDPDHRLVAAFHLFDVYPCVTTSCWDSQVAQVAAKVPLVATEVGSYLCDPSIPKAFYSWAARHGVSFLGAFWDVGSCGQGSSLLETSPSGTPSPLGAALKTALG